MYSHYVAASKVGNIHWTTYYDETIVLYRTKKDLIEMLYEISNIASYILGKFAQYKMSAIPAISWFPMLNDKIRLPIL